MILSLGDLFDAASLFEDLQVSEGNMGTNQQRPPPGLQRAWHRKTGSSGSVCSKLRGHVRLLSDWTRAACSETSIGPLSYLISPLEGRGRGGDSSPRPGQRPTAERQKLDSVPSWTTITQMQIHPGFIALLTVQDKSSVDVGFETHG